MGKEKISEQVVHSLLLKTEHTVSQFLQWQVPIGYHLQIQPWHVKYSAIQ